MLGHACGRQTVCRSWFSSTVAPSWWEGPLLLHYLLSPTTYFLKMLTTAPPCFFKHYKININLQNHQKSYARMVFTLSVQRTNGTYLYVSQRRPHLCVRQALLHVLVSIDELLIHFNVTGSTLMSVTVITTLRTCCRGP